MTFTEMVDACRSIVKDAEPSIVAGIPDYINEALLWAADEVILPSLKTVTSVTTNTSQAYISMPTRFDGRLVWIGNSDGPIYISPNGLAGILDDYPTLTESGDITMVALEGTVLWYQPIPSTAVSLTCIVCYKPTSLVNDTDTPTDFPDYLHREILVEKAASIAYNIIESGQEVRTNSGIHERNALAGIIKLKQWLSRRKTSLTTTYWSA